MSNALPGPLRDFFSSRTGIAVLVVAVLAAAGLTAVALGGDENEPLPQAATELPTTTTVPPPAAPTGTVLVGASTSAEVRTIAGEKAAVEELERHLGRKLDIDHNFYPWEEPFPTESERWNLAAGRIPMISWNGRGPTTAQIAAGQFDDMVRQRARATKALGEPVLIRWFWEMDGNKKADYAGTPEEYIAAWQHIVRIFRNEGADNVSWVWCPNASAFNDGQAQQFYPGDEFVDWMCADGYNWAPGRGDDYRSFTEIFGGFYGWAALHDKPIMVGEFGVQERNPGEKAQWITDARRALKTDFPLMRAIVYFNSNKDFDWRLTTSDSAVKAFRQMAHDPYFNVEANRRLPL